MTSILTKIIKNKLSWIVNRKKIQPLSIFKNDIILSDRDFHQSLKKTHPAFILEFKKASPSLGVLNNFDPKFVAKIYKKYASAISVLTDEEYFHGKFEFIPTIRNIAVNQPILCKDFFIDPYQIYLARYYQADAILLMLSILNDYQYLLLKKLAKSLNMGILTEINNIEELNRAINLNAKIIGINNRNLHDFSISMTNTPHLASKIPKNIIIISESGIKNYHQLRQLKSIVQGFLIGSSLMVKTNLENAIRKIIIGNNKICGLTRLQDVKMSKKYGAIYAGFIFCKSSPRCINFETAININNVILMKYIGVFCNEDISIIIRLVKYLSLYAVQLHGQEDQIYINNLRKKLPENIKIWKAISLNNKSKPLNFKYVDKYVFDNTHGGSGSPFDWLLLKNQELNNIILAGGLNIKNCILASNLGCFGLDFNSGLETYPGIKDKSKIKLLFRSLREHKIIINKKCIN
ncbi:MAG: bifunctional indole-3-glycerol-phosphate synthase TrpC/phosphoribosylanthranilate isomerase TrpF [Buchnera aphidicola (Kaburagia rhusicola ensigallis)]